MTGQKAGQRTVRRHARRARNDHDVVSTDVAAVTSCMEGGDHHGPLKRWPAEPDTGIRDPFLECQDCGATFPLPDHLWSPS